MRRYNQQQVMKPIYRGSSPSLLFRIPYKDTSLIADGYLTFYQRGAVVFDKKFTDESVSLLAGAIVVDLTQEETLKLTAVDTCKVQPRYNLLYGKTAVGNVWEIPVLDTLKGGEI